MTGLPEDCIDAYKASVGDYLTYLFGLSYGNGSNSAQVRPEERKEVSETIIEPNEALDRITEILSRYGGRQFTDLPPEARAELVQTLEASGRIL